jgi:Zn-dependent protease with chaperone function
VITGSGAEGPVTQSAPIDERVLQAGTTLRFILLVLLFITASAAMTSNLVALVADPGNNQSGCLLADGVNPAGGFWQALVSVSNGNNTALNACLAQYVPDAAWVPGAVTAGLIAAAYCLYRLLPLWMRWRRRLVPLDRVDERGVLRAQVAELAVAAGLLPGRLSVLASPSAATAGALVFGNRRRQVLALDAGLLVTSSTDPQRFRAVVLHELAHLRNGDLGLTYATVALWRVFVVAVLLPRAGALVYEAVTNTAPASWGNTGGAVNALIQLIVIVALVYLARADILRVREIYADRTAARWGAGREAWSGADRTPSGPRARGRAMVRELLSTHPSWAVRARSLTDPVALFTPGALLMFLTGTAADITSVQLLLAGDSVTSLQAEGQALLMAGLIAAIAGVAVWRAVTYAVIAGRPAMSGLSAGLWLGAGVILGELTDVFDTDGRAFPSQPESLLILAVACVLVTVWTAQFAELRIRTWQGRSLRRAITAGLIVPWLVLAFVLYWWFWNGSGLASGWIYNTGGIIQALGLPGLSAPAHPGLLLTFEATLLVLPGSDTSFGGLWWALSLLWMVPLLLLAARPPALAPGWLTRALGRGVNPALPAVDPPRLQSVLWPGLAGGLAAAAGFLAVLARLHTPGGIASQPRPGAAELAYATWCIIMPSAVAILTAAVVAAYGERRWYLLRALVAGGLAALSGFAAEYLLQSVQGCLGTFNVLTPVCQWRPATPWPLAETTLGYVLGPAIVLAGVAAILTGAVRWHPSRAARQPARAAAAGPRGRAARLAVIAVVSLVTVGLIGADTVRSTLVNQGPAAPAADAAQIEKPPAPVPPQTARLQLQAWLAFGGNALERETVSAERDFGDALNTLAHSSPRRAALVFQNDMPPACARFARLADQARAYFPVPIGAGQRLWARAVAGFGATVTACQTMLRRPTTATVVATATDSERAVLSLNALGHWISRDGVDR